MKKISELFDANFGAISRAEFIRDNNVKYETVSVNYGLCFCMVRIIDERFESENLFVASGSLHF